MKKGKALRLGGFVVAACATTALAATAVQSTGAWFSDSQGGTINANSGHLQLKINYGSGYTDDHNAIDLNYNNLMPGTNVADHIPYQIGIDGGTADVWLVIDTGGSNISLPDDPAGTTTKTGTPYQLFTGGGAPGGADNNGLGRYGFFQVDDTNGGTAFVSGNLKFPDVTNTPGMPGACPTDANGRGGSAAVSDGTTTPPYCGVPAKILLASGLGNNATGTVTVTLGLNGPLQKWQGQPEPSVSYHLVAVQTGQTP